MPGEVFVEGDGVLAAGGGVAVADEVVGEVAGAVAVVRDGRTDSLRIREVEEPHAENLFQSLGDRLSLPPMSTPEHPHHFAQDDIVYEQPAVRLLGLLQQTMDTINLRSIVIDEIAKEHVRIDRDHGFFLASRRMRSLSSAWNLSIASFISSTLIGRWPGISNIPRNSREAPPPLRMTFSPLSLPKRLPLSPAANPAFSRIASGRSSLPSAEIVAIAMQ